MEEFKTDETFNIKNRNASGLYCVAVDRFFELKINECNWNLGYICQTG